MTRYRRLGAAALMVSMLAWAGSAVHAAGRTHEMGEQKSGKAYISGLQGNVKDAGDHYNVSGTNVTVRMYVKKSWPNALHSCSARLGSQVLAAPLDVRMNPNCDGIGLLFATDGSGDWCSESEKGYVKFPSTSLLASGTEGELRIGVIPDGHAAILSDTLDKPVRLYNKAYVLSNWVIPWGSTSAIYVHAKCEEMNHTASPIEEENESHDKNTILDNLQTYTVFYMDTHGSSDDQMYFVDCRHHTDLNEVVLKSDVAAWVSYKTAQPAYNVVHLDACHTADNQDMAQAFGILDGSYDARPDRAYIGWVGLSGATLSNLHWTQRVWDRLAEGQTVEEAVDDANSHCLEAGTARIFGDNNTRLHAVYGGVMEPAQ